MAYLSFENVTNPTYKVGDIVWGIRFRSERACKFTIAKIADGFAFDKNGARFRMCAISKTKSGLIRMIFDD